MKTPQNRIGLSLGTLVLGGWMAGTAMVAAQDSPPRPGPPSGSPPPPHMEGAPKDAPQAMRMRMAMERVEELRRAGKHDEAQQLAQRIQGAGRDRPQMDREKKERQPKVRGEDRKPERSAHPMPPIAQARMKMMRLKQAAQLLQEAGYPDQAAKARQEIERIEVEVRREAEKDKARMMAEKDKAHRESAEKADGGMREEMMKLRREIEELRQQMRRMQAERGPKPPGDMPPPHDRRPE